jgi:hypothetical protein
MISVSNQAKLLSISESDVIDFMMSGFNFYDTNKMVYVAEAKDLNAIILHNSKSLSMLKEKVDETSFMISNKNSILEISSEKVSPTLFFLSDLMYKSMNPNQDISTLYVLIPMRHSGSMFISELDLILRLSDSFEGNYDIINFMDIVESVSRYDKWA